MTATVAWRPFERSTRIASVRLRSYRVISYLRAAGWSVDFERDGEPADIVVFQKAYSAADLDHARRLKSRGTRIVADFCDNHLWSSDWTPELRARADRMRRLIELADVCVASTDALASVLGRESHVAHDALATPPGWVGRRLARWHGRDRSALRLLWFGTAGGSGASGGLQDLKTVVELVAADELLRSRTTLLVVSNSREEYERHIESPFPSRYLPWTTTSFRLATAASDVVVVPVVLDPFTAAKTSNRPARALLAGLPVIADQVPSYAELRPGIRFGDWVDHLKLYMDPQVRSEDVRAGQARAAAVYAQHAVTAEWEVALQDALQE